MHKKMGELKVRGTFMCRRFLSFYGCGGVAGVFADGITYRVRNTEVSRWRRAAGVKPRGRY